jgi:small-conductance mechanosensitive channel
MRWKDNIVVVVAVVFIIIIIIIIKFVFAVWVYYVLEDTVNKQCVYCYKIYILENKKETLRKLNRDWK